MKRLVILALVLSACTLNSRGPWVDEFGTQMSGNDIVEYDGFAACGQEQVIFMRFFGDQYAKDSFRVLGELRSPIDDRVLEFALLDAVPEDAEPTGITHAGREIFVGPDRPDYLYIRLPGGSAERWPRAEVECVTS